MNNSITQKIKALLNLSGKSQKDLADYMEISPQSLSNKLVRGSFSADDLIKVATFSGAELSFSIRDTKIILDGSDIRKN